MKSVLALLSFGLYSTLLSQSTLLKVGDKAPDFIVDVDNNTIQSYIMPHMKDLVLLHFWNTDLAFSKNQNLYLKRLLARYATASYKNAEGFEVISVAVQADQKSWKEAIQRDTLKAFNNGIAKRGLNDDVCKKYQVVNLPADILIDEEGSIIAINPTMTEVENLLDDRKNHQAMKKDLVGFLAQSSNKKEVLKYTKLYLFNYYGDSVSSSRSSSAGYFNFSGIKINQDYQLKVDNQMDILSSDPVALYTNSGEFIMDGRTASGGFIFPINARISNLLAYKDTVGRNKGVLEELDVIKLLSFSADGTSLTKKDELDLATILNHLLKNKNLKIEFNVHTDSRISAERAIEITSIQVSTLQTYFQQKGIDPKRIVGVAKGNTELRKLCGNGTDCSEEDHHLNRRVEFITYKD